MSKIKLKTIKYYDYHELVKAVETKSGRKVRDWSGRQGGLVRGRQDFWLYILDNLFIDVYNGSIKEFSPKEELANEKLKGIKENLWVQEILEYFIQVFEENNLPDSVKIMIKW